MRAATKNTIPANNDGLFQSTLPMRAATQMPAMQQARWTFQSTLPMRAATTIRAEVASDWKISIHAAHAGSDSISTFATGC